MEGKSNIKRNRMLICVGIIVMFALAWFYIFNNSAQISAKYNYYIKTAREASEKELYKKANPYYEAALQIRKTLDLQCEQAEMYYKWGKYFEYERKLEDIIEANKRSSKGYEMLASYYQETAEYGDCIKTIKSAKSYHVTSEKLQKIEDEIKYKYKLGYSTSLFVSEFYNDLCLMQNQEGFYGVANSVGNTIVKCQYLRMAPFVAEEMTPATEDGTSFWMIDKDGDKVNAPKDKKLKFDDIGTFAEGKMPVKIDNHYSYANEEYDILFGKYDEAYAFNNGKAMVKSDNVYYLINSEGKKISKNTYKNIIVDELGYACREGIYIVDNGDGYYLMDKNEKKIGKEKFEDARLCNGDDYLAVKKDGLWGFCDKSGKIVIKPTYQNAKSFANGLAAVQITDVWGYIDKENKEVIQAIFADAKGFSSTGSAYVKLGDEWQLLSLYR